MTGDFYPRSGCSNIDRVNGGSIDGTLAIFTQAIALADPNMRTIAGYG
jgi:hypothetical protein